VTKTTERFDPTEPKTVEDLVMGLIHRYAYTVAASSIQPGAPVLDVGFGEGYGAEILATSNYIGVELDEEIVALARARYPKFRFERYDGVHLPRGPFDLVVSFQVVEHVRDPEPWLAEISRVTNHAMFTTPNRVHRLPDGGRPWNRYHVREFTAGELRALLAPHFDDVIVHGVSAPPEIEAIELARYARARRIARLDRLGLRHRLPTSVDAWVRKRLRKPVVPTSQVRFDLTDLRHSEDLAKTGLDLLAIATNHRVLRGRQHI
jgi:SAM-dependent methyltransferase